MPPNITATTGDTATTGASATPGKSGRKKKGRKARLLVLVLVLAIIGGVAYGAYWSISIGPRLLPADHGNDQARRSVRAGRREAGTATASRRSTRPRTRTCSWRRASSRRRTGSTRWTCAGT
ncbi:hypothetical protein LT493_27810 [Streptomyces tricolor]|nr:hypothetical protein [Streptomyces tricolor]